MNFEEHAAKSLVLNPAGIPVPRGILCISDAEAAMAAAKIKTALKVRKIASSPAFPKSI